MSRCVAKSSIPASMSRCVAAPSPAAPLATAAVTCHAVTRGAPRSQRGFSLIAAIFLIVVLAALGAFVVRIGATQQQTVSFAVLGARAAAAANAGIEFGANRALQANSCAPTTTLNLTEASLAGFTVQVTCAAASHATVGPAKLSYALDATASKGIYGRPDFVSRHVARTVTAP